MNTGMIFTGSVSFLVFLSAFATGLFIFKRRSKENKFLVPFSIFLVVTSGIWFFVSLQLFASWLGKTNFQHLCFLIGQVFVFFSAVPLAWYLILKFFRKKIIIRVVMIVYLTIAFFGTFLLLKFGFTHGESTYFADKLKPNDLAFSVFVMMIAPLIIASIFDSLRGIVGWLKKKEVARLYEFFYSLVIVVYLSLGVLDEQGLIAGWGLVFFRLIFAAVFLMAYLTFHFQYLSKEELIENLYKKEPKILK